MKIIFVSMDTMRADRLGCLGNRRALTPTLDRFAGEGALFERAFATDIPTQPSHTALFTGRFGVNTGVVSHFLPSTSLAENEPWLPSILRQKGLRSAAVDHLFSMKGWFERGYDEYMPPPGRSRAPASVINDLAFPWIEAHADEEFFLFLHYWDAHIPYVPPDEFRKYSASSQSSVDPLVRQRLRSRPTYPLFKHNLYDHLGEIPSVDYIADLYDDEIAYLDYELGRLADHLSELGILDDTMLVFFGDHGENMDEHDAWFDHAGLYDSVVHVPLIIWRPGLVPPSRVSPMVALVDVMPTTLELLGYDVPGGLDGRSLVPLLEGTTTRHRDELVLCEATWQAKRAIRTEEWKLIRCYDPGVFLRSETELYHLGKDPNERENVADAHPDVVRALEGRLDRWLDAQLGSQVDPVALAVAEGLPAVARLDRVIEGSERGNAPERTAVENGHLVAATASS
ncbi:MAG TPA: sulfatase, partial [Acidimicrobiales bacterium]|nr:sulfatase [Acidimicrobiales bacterium]